MPTCIRVHKSKKTCCNCWREWQDGLSIAPLQSMTNDVPVESLSTGGLLGVQVDTRPKRAWEASELTCLACQELQHKAFQIQPSLWGGGGLAPMSLCSGLQWLVPGRVLRSATHLKTQALSGSQSLLLVTGFTLGQWQISPLVTNNQTDLCCWFFTVCWQTEQ